MMMSDHPALDDLERRRNLVASELARLGAALDEALGTAEAIHVDELVEALEPEVTFAALDLLARRRPAAVGSGVAPLLPGFAALPATPAGFQQVAAQELLDEMMEGVLGGTISPGFCNVGAHVLASYLPS